MLQKNGVLGDMGPCASEFSPLLSSPLLVVHRVGKSVRRLEEEEDEDGTWN